MLTMMTNYTNHNYNSNNDDDNISITILRINFNPFRCTGNFGCGPAYWSTCIGTLVAEGKTDQRDKKQPTMIATSPVLGLSIGEGWLEGDYTGAWGASEGGSGSVERDRQNRDLYSNWTNCCENPANRSEQVQHNGWFLSTFCMTDNNTV